MNDNGNLTFEDMFKQFGEFFKHYLMNPVFRSNIEYLMRVSIQEKDNYNILKTIDIIDEKYDFELSDKLSKKPWIPKVLDKEDSLNLVITPPPEVFADLVMANVS